MRYMRLLVCIGLAFMLTASSVFATGETESYQPNWIEGGKTVQVGNFSSLKLDESLLYLDKADTMEIQEYFGNTVSGTEVGSVFPENDEENWFVLFDYEEVGHISDKEKNKINAKELLKSYQEGTEAHNEELPEQEQLHVKGWHTEPYYDDKERTLIWALLAEDYEKNSIINYNVRILTREGFVSVLLVTDEENLDEHIALLKKLILPNYSITAGFKYEDFDPSVDKESEFGLTGLILGGAGLAIAKKAGLLGIVLVLLKKFWIVLFAIPVAIWRWFKKKAYGTDGRDNSADSASSDQTINPDQK